MQVLGSQVLNLNVKKTAERFFFKPKDRAVYRHIRDSNCGRLSVDNHHTQQSRAAAASCNT
jgi:hypothetical protein